MAKWVKISLLLTLLGVILISAPYIQGNQGYILISFGNWSIQGTIVQFSAALLTVAVVVFVVWLLVKYVFLTLILPSKWWQNRAEKNHANLFQSGLDYMTLGLWFQAAEQFLKVKRLSQVKTARELALVCATQANDTKLTELVFNKLSITDNIEDSEYEANIARVYLLLQQGDNESAVKVMSQLQGQSLKQSLPFQQLWLFAQIRLFDWKQVQKQLIKLENKVNKQYSDLAIQNWQTKLEQELTKAFSNYVYHFSVNQLQTVWKGFNKAMQKHPAISNSYISALVEQQQPQLAEEVLLMQSNETQWLLDNVRNCYLLLGKTPFESLFIVCQKQLNKDQNNKTLLTVYAYLAAGQKDFQLAKQALEQTVFSNKNATDMRLYAEVLAELGEVRHSVDVFKTL